MPKIRIDYDTKKTIQRLYEAGMEIKEISNLLKISYITARKYALNGGNKKLDFIVVQANDGTDFSIQINHLLEQGWNLLGTTQVLVDPLSSKELRFIQTLTKRTKIPNIKVEGGNSPRRGRPPKVSPTSFESE